MPGIRRIALGIWLALTVGLAIAYAVNPEWLEPERVVATLRGAPGPILLGYVVLNIVRSFTLIPSTVLIVVGMLLFPDRPWFVATASLVGIVCSAGLIYYFFEFLGLAELFERHHAPRVRWLEDQMGRKGFLIVVGWSMFPFVPTDVICYVAGTLKMHVGTFLLGVALGEIPIVAFYVVATGRLVGG
jgi:uncharacterized membrane protein YdjX (TVP38/TMEM64 family)